MPKFISFYVNTVDYVCEKVGRFVLDGVVDPTSSDDIQCKICWDNTSTVENPLLNSCSCAGSVRYIHYECLKYWLK